MTENEKYLYDQFLISIKSGFQSLEDIIEETLEVLEDEGWESEISEEWVCNTIQIEYNKHISRSEKWQHPTDTERLCDVFDKLSSLGIISLHNAGYTQSDAIYDVKHLWEDLEDEGLKPIGYCYYHGQDLERAIEQGVLILGFYGKKDNNDKEAIVIGNKIVETLKEAGFTVNWNGTASKRIEIQNFNWENIFTSDDDVEKKWGYDRIFDLMKQSNLKNE